MNDVPQFDGSTIKDRTSDFETWVREIRDPAIKNAECIRRLVSRNRKAMAEYSVAQIGVDQWAMRTRLEYACGDFEGRGTPWEPHSSRDECIEEFFASATDFFSYAKSFRLQEQSRLQMLELLQQRTGLFGVIEPPEVRES